MHPVSSWIDSRTSMFTKLAMWVTNLTNSQHIKNIGTLVERIDMSMNNQCDREDKLFVFLTVGQTCGQRGPGHTHRTPPGFPRRDPLRKFLKNMFCTTVLEIVEHFSCARKPRKQGRRGNRSATRSRQPLLMSWQLLQKSASRASSSLFFLQRNSYNSLNCPASFTGDTLLHECVQGHARSFGALPASNVNDRTRRPGGSASVRWWANNGKHHLFFQWKLALGRCHGAPGKSAQNNDAI